MIHQSTMIETFLPPTQQCPVSHQQSPLWLIPTIWNIISASTPALKDAPFIFDLTEDAANHNMLVLLAHNSTIKSVIDNHKHTFLKHGSEFWPASSLQHLLMHHPWWPKLLSLLAMGSHWPLHPILDNNRQARAALATIPLVLLPDVCKLI